MLDPSTTSRTRAWVEIRLDLLRENYQTARRAIAADARLVPMVKAEAYGVGMPAVVSTLQGLPGADQPWAFGVAAVSEGERLRALDWQGRILVFSPAPPQDYLRAAEAELTLCLSDLPAVRLWADAAREAGRNLPFHLEIDTGMGRAGFPWQAAEQWGREVVQTAGDWLTWEGTYTHFHSADEEDPQPTEQQWDRFQRALTHLPRLEPAPEVHVANSAAIMRMSGFGCKIARPGIYLYGGRAGPDVEPAPVVSVRTRLVLVREVPTGSTVGYGATYRASRNERWGTLCIGYGDGIPRRLAMAGGEVIVRGRRVPIIGRISMDMVTVDLSTVPEAELGDEVTLIGESGGEQILVDEVAKRCGTISYEILTGLGSRLPRIYLEGPMDGFV